MKWIQGVKRLQIQAEHVLFSDIFLNMSDCACCVILHIFYKENKTYTCEKNRPFSDITKVSGENFY